MTDYEKQARDFLTKHNITFAVHKASGCPGWGDPGGKGSCSKCGTTHGQKYNVVISGESRSITFPFWGSLKDAQEGTRPTHYDVLACISSDVTTPDTFEDFCGEFGYDTDSRKAYRDWERCHAFATELRAFFTESELTELAEIQ